MARSKVSFTGAMLLEDDRDSLLVRAGHRENPAMAGWEEKAEHMTLCLGPASSEGFEEWLNREVEITVVAFGSLFFENGSGIAAVRVECDAPSKNDVKHITIAYDKANGVKPKQSNDIQEWTTLPEPFKLRALVREVEFAPAVGAST